MNTYFNKGNWNPTVYNALNCIIDQYKSTNETNKQERNYVVFDFDDTSSIDNTLEHTTVYAINHLAYRLKPSEFSNLIRALRPEIKGPWIKDRPETTLDNLLDDIIDNYSWLYTHYINHPNNNNSLLADIKKTQQFKDFRAKLWFYYITRHDFKFTREKGKPWTIYLFAGYTPEELIQMTRKALRYMSELPIKSHIFKSSASGKTGVIESEFITGIRFPEETINLYQAFQEYYIDTYIVSASPYEIIVAAAEEFGYNVPRNQIFGMTTLNDSNGKINSILDPGSILTIKEGKSELIRKNIFPHYNKDPLATFGDSMGDYDMMTSFKGTKINVLFNRYFTDATREIVRDSVKKTAEKNPRFVIQGRDENKNELRPSPKTIPFGYDKEILTIDELPKH